MSQREGCIALDRRRHFDPPPIVKRPLPSSAEAPATCGELVQGFLDGQDFLINSPIDLSSVVLAYPTESGRVEVKSPGIYTKSQETVEYMMKQTGLTGMGFGVDLHFVTTIPRGKGLASSTAEISAALMAVSRAFRLELSPSVITSMSTVRDSTDGTALPGISRLNQLTGRRMEALGMPPPLRFILVDTGGEIESFTFDRERARAHAMKREDRLRQAVALVSRGLRSGDSRAVADGATLSAVINNSFLPKPGFLELLEGTKEEGALGVNCAHTGTVLGVMYDPRETCGERLQHRIEELVPSDSVMGDYRLTGGAAL